MTQTGNPPGGGFDQYTSDVYGWAYRLLGRHHDALDVVQDVFLRWNAQCARQAPELPRGWLRRVTLNRAIDLRRKRHLDPMSSDDALATAAVEVDASLSVDREVLRGDIALAIDQLTDAQRGVLVAKVYDGMTFAQIARELDLGLSTVKTHYLRAVRSMRDRLQGRWAKEAL